MKTKRIRRKADMKFRFMDKVLVTNDGFYHGHVGVIDDIAQEENGPYPYIYVVKFGDRKITLSEKSLVKYIPVSD